MESEGMNLLINSTVLITVFIGACVLLLMYIIKLLNADQKNVEHKRKSKIYRIFSLLHYDKT